MSYVIRFLLIVATLISFAAHTKDTIILWDDNYDNEPSAAFIRLAAELTKEDYGDYDIIPSLPYEQGRAFLSLDEPGQVNVMIVSVSQRREEQASVIYVPLERGLAGFRICLVKNEKKDAFAGINTLRDFRKRKLYIGVGAHWPDREVLEANNLPVATSPITDDLYAMLNAERFDCFSRNIKEISGNLVDKSQLDIGVDQHIAFIYPSANFIHVSKNAPRIKERLETGLQRAIDNGEFYALFDKYYKNSLLKHNLYGRKLFFLKNDNMSQKAKDAINQYGIASFSSNY